MGKHKDKPELSIPTSIGRIAMLWHNECAVPRRTWVAAAVVAADLALYAFFKAPSWKQVVEVTTGKSWLHTAREVAEDIEPLEKAGGALGEKWVFAGAAAIDTLAWFVFLADLFADFLWNWTSMIMEFSPCALPDDQKPISSVSPFGGFTNQGFWTVGPAWLVNNRGTPSIISSEFSVPPGASYRAAAQLLLSAFLGVPAVYQLRIYNVTTGTVLDEQGMSTEDLIEQRSPVVMTAEGVAGKQTEIIALQVFIAPTPGFIEMLASDGFFDYFVREVHVPKPRPKSYPQPKRNYARNRRGYRGGKNHPSPMYKPRNKRTEPI